MMNSDFNEECGTQLEYTHYQYVATITGADWIRSYSFANPDSANQLKIDSKNNSATFSNDHEILTTNPSRDDLKHYVLWETRSFTNTYFEYILTYGVIGFYTRGSTALSKIENYTYTSDVQALAIYFAFIVATRPTADLKSWTNESINSTSAKRISISNKSTQQLVAVSVDTFDLN